MGRRKAEVSGAAIVLMEPTEKVEVEVVKTTCPHCFRDMPARAAKKVIDKPYRIMSFDDMCKKHQRKFLKSFSDKDKPLAIETVNTVAGAINPMAFIFLDSVPFLVEEKKKRDIQRLAQKAEMDKYINALNEKVSKALAAEEARRQDLAAKGLPEAETSSPKNMRLRRGTKRKKTDGAKKLSKIVENMGKGGLLPSELMDIASNVGLYAGKTRDDKP